MRAFELEIYSSSLLIADVRHLASVGQTGKILVTTKVYFDNIPAKIIALEKTYGQASSLRKLDLSAEALAAKWEPESESGEVSEIHPKNDKQRVRIIEE